MKAQQAGRIRGPFLAAREAFAEGVPRGKRMLMEFSPLPLAGGRKTRRSHFWTKQKNKIPPQEEQEQEK